MLLTTRIAEAELVDQTLVHEDREFQELVALVEDHRQQCHDGEYVMTDCANDEEAYDELFMGLMSNKEPALISSVPIEKSATELVPVMDLSAGQHDPQIRDTRYDRELLWSSQRLD